MCVHVCICVCVCAYVWMKALSSHLSLFSLCTDNVMIWKMTVMEQIGECTSAKDEVGEKLTVMGEPQDHDGRECRTVQRSSSLFSLADCHCKIIVCVASIYGDSETL